jgi:predicted ArsR family transcriptional regulator
MTQEERDRLVVLKKALKKLIKQSQAAAELRISARQVRRLLRGLRAKGDKVVVHGLRGCVEPEAKFGRTREDHTDLVGRGIPRLRANVG